MTKSKKTKTNKKPAIKNQKSVSPTKNSPSKNLFVKNRKKAAISPELMPSVSVSQNVLQSYLSHISRIPVLSKEEEFKLTSQYYENGDPEIAKKIIQSNLRFVVKVASEYGKFNMKIMDLIQEGNIGLLKAVKEFNPYKGARLITYAVWWIRGYIQEYLLKNHSIVRVGTNKRQQKLFYLLQKEKQALEEFGRAKMLPGIASSSNSSNKEAEAMEQVVFRKDLSFDQPLARDGTTTFLDVQTDGSSSIEEDLASQEQAALLRKHLKKMEEDLSDKEKSVIKNRLLKQPPATLQEIANEFSVSREAIRQTEERLLKKLREKLIPILKKP